jgi:plasmid stabilization system protein ParE
VLSVGASGYVALYRFDEKRDAVLILRVRHQREAGSPSL